MKRKIVLSVGSLILSLCVLFLAFEILVRCCTGRSMVVREIESGNLFTLSDRFYLIRETTKGKRLVRNANVKILNHQLSGRNVDIRTNAQGFRYDDLPEEKNDNEVRMLFLADSVTLVNYYLNDSRPPANGF